jgi:hypothetical protein
MNAIKLAEFISAARSAHLAMAEEVLTNAERKQHGGAATALFELALNAASLLPPHRRSKFLARCEPKSH